MPSENELVEIFQVSKTAVREALSVLAAKGIVEKRPGVGSILKEVTGSTLIEPITSKLIIKKKSLREILEFRRGIEVEATALAAVRVTKEQLKAIENAHMELIEKNNSGSIGIEEDYRFHSLIILSSGNSIYETIFDSVSTMFLGCYANHETTIHRAIGALLYRIIRRASPYPKGIENKKSRESTTCDVDSLEK